MDDHDSFNDLLAAAMPASHFFRMVMRGSLEGNQNHRSIPGYIFKKWIRFHCNFSFPFRGDQ
jgi:hypothetical protein